MKNNTFVIPFLIFIVAILLRIWGLNSDGELWLDEITTYYCCCVKSLHKVQILSLMQTGQPPLYQYILWFWIKIFGDSDWGMKFLSVIFSSISVIVAYFCGREAEGEKTGIIFSALMAISGISIYYAQEVRPYGLIILLTTLTLLFLLKLVKNFNYINLGLFTFINILLLYTHTCAYIFFFFEILVLLIYFYRHKRHHLKPMILSSLIIGIVSLPFICELIILRGGNNYPDRRNFLDVAFSFINNYVSPHLININYQQLGTKLSDTFQTPNHFLLMTVFSFLLIAVYMGAIAKSLQNNNFNRYLFAIWFLYIIALAFSALLGKIGFISRYTLIPFPFFLFLVSYGLTLFNKKSLFAIILALNFIFMFSFPKINAQNLKKTVHLSYFNDLPTTLNKYKFQPNDIFIIFYYYSTPGFAKKYYDFIPSCQYYLFQDYYQDSLGERTIKFVRLLDKIKQNKTFGKNLIIAIPADHFFWYEKTIKTAHLETKYKKVVKLNENNWITIMYSNVPIQSNN